MAGKQSEIPGTEREVNKAVENAGDLLVSAVKKKTSATKAAKKAEDHLLQVMHDEKVQSYTSEALGKTFEIESPEKVKVYAWESPGEKAETKSKRGGEDAH